MIFRIILAANEDRIKLKLILRNVANLISPLLFSTSFKREKELYISPTIDTIMRSNWNSALEIKPTAQKESTTPEVVEAIMPQKLEYAESGFSTQNSSLSLKKSRPATAKTPLVLDLDAAQIETDGDIKNSYIGLSSVQLYITLFDQSLALTWDGFAIDILVRYWEHIFCIYELEEE